MKTQRVLKRIPEDIAWILEASDDGEHGEELTVGELWEIGGQRISGGMNHAGKEE